MKNFYIEELKDGRVRYRMSYKDPLTNKTKRVTANYEHDSVRNRRKAETELAEKIDTILKQVDYSAITISEVYDKYCDYVTNTFKASTARRNSNTIGVILSAYPDKTMIRNITPALWKEGMLSLAKKKNGNGTYNEYSKRLKVFLRWCYQNDYIDDLSQLEKLTSLPAKTKREKVQDKYLEPEEASALLAEMEGMTQWKLLTQFLILSGLRIGEAVALDYSDIGKTHIHVTKTYDYVDDKCTTTKTLTSTRDVAIQKELAECINDIKTFNAWYSGVNGFKDRNIFFPDKEGNRLHYDAYRKYLKETSAKVTHKKVTPHTLRHTHVSLMFAAGIPLDVISRRVGHEGSKVTKEIYLHLTEKLKQKDSDVIQTITLL